jgi:hypothetical protein
MNTKTPDQSSPHHHHNILNINQPLISVDLLRSSWRSDDFPQGWSEGQRVHSLRRYEMFLLLKQMHPRERLAPTMDIDKFWHLHMLSPVAYQRDCMRAFGHVMDHDGGYGKEASEVPTLELTFNRTAQLWEGAFGEPYLLDGTWLRDAAMTKCWHDCSGRCWHACSEADAA